MRMIRRVALGLAALAAALAYVWVAAVRAAPSVRRRKAAARVSRRA